MNLDDIIDAKLAAEEARLRKVIADAEQRLETIAEFRRAKSDLAPVFKAEPEGVSGPTHVGATAESIEFSLGRKTGRVPTLKEQILDTSEAVLVDGKRRSSRELLRELAYRGIVLGGRDPVTNLASYLSKEKDRFQSDKKAGGWTLVRLLKQTRPGSAPTLPGLFSNSNGADKRPYAAG